MSETPFILVNLWGIAGTRVSLRVMPAGFPLWAVAALVGVVIGLGLVRRWLPLAVLRYLLAAVLVIAGVKLMFV
jgi:hypothetical protein